MAAPMPGAAPGAALAVWRIGTWIVLLLAAFAGVQYAHHAEYGYLAGALGVIVVCAGGLLRQPWALGALRALAVLLAGWAVVTAVLMLLQWGQFEQARQQVSSQPQAPILLLLIEQARRSAMIELALKALLVPLLLWLAWQLGRPAVRAQFRPRR